MRSWIEWEHLALAPLVWVLLTAGSLAIVLRIVLLRPPPSQRNAPR